MNLTLKPISDFLENPPEDFVIYGAGNGCADILRELDKVCEECGITRIPRYIIDKNAAEIGEFITPSGDAVPVITLEKYAETRDNEKIVMSIYMDRFGSKVYVQIILDIYEIIGEMTIFTDPIIASLPSDKLHELTKKTIRVVWPRWTGYSDDLNDVKNIAAKAEWLVDNGWEADEVYETILIEPNNYKKIVADLDNRLIMRSQKPRDNEQILFIFGASQINDHFWRSEIKTKFESMASNHGLKLQTKMFSAQSLYDAVYMIFGMDIRAGDRIILPLDPLFISCNEKALLRKQLFIRTTI